MKSALSFLVWIRRSLEVALIVGVAIGYCIHRNRLSRLRAPLSWTKVPCLTWAERSAGSTLLP
jgi:hypothetical protein